MVLDTPLLRVSRPVAACSRCRAAKVKCDGKLPACTACEKSNKAAECSSTNDQFARGKERSYVATLESRVEKLEKKLAEARLRRKSSVAMSDFDGSATPRKMSYDMLMSRHVPGAPGKAARRKEAHDIDNLVSDFGLLAVNATARDFHGFTSAMSYARLILSACAKEPMPQNVHKGLPPRYAATPLIQHYLSNVFVLLPVFDEATFYASVDAVYHHDRSKATAFDHWTVRLVLALSSISLSKQRGDAQYFDAVGYANGALEYAEEVLHPGFITSIQALILLTEYALMDPQHFDSWGLIGAASRAMVDIGLHQDPVKRARLSKAKVELRRRVFWCVYSLDRSTSLVQARAFSFGDDSSNVSLPFNSNISPSRNPHKSHLWRQDFEPAVNFFKIRQIQSEWYTELFQSSREQSPEAYTYIWKIYREMTDWSNNISKNTLPTTKTFFELELLYSYVYVLSPSPRCPIISNYAQRLIFEHCIAYAIHLLAALSDDTSPTTRIPMTFYDAMRAYMTGRQFVDVLQRNPDVLLNPVPPTPPATSPPPLNTHDSLDPFAAPPEINPPPFPAPVLPLNTSLTQQPIPYDPTTRALGAIASFTEILARFGLRFGYINWRDRFQRESSALVEQLRTRQASSPTPQPQPQMAYMTASNTQKQQQQQSAAPAQSRPPQTPTSGPTTQQPQFSQPIYPGYAPHHPPPNAAAAQAAQAVLQPVTPVQPQVPGGFERSQSSASMSGLAAPVSAFGSYSGQANVSPGSGLGFPGPDGGQGGGGDYMGGRFI